MLIKNFHALFEFFIAFIKQYLEICNTRYKSTKQRIGIAFDTVLSNDNAAWHGFIKLDFAC